MIKFESLTIENGRTYKNITVPLRNQGIVSITGKNGGGKSTLWALMEVVFYGSTPSGDKRDELVKNTKDASFKTNFNKDGHDYTVSYSRVKKKWEHSIVKDLAVQDFHSRTDTSQAAATILGLTKPEFEGSIHLTQNSQHVLMDGKPAARKLYLSEFFGLDERYDQIHASAKVELGKVQEQIESLSALSYTLQAHRDELALTPQADVEPIAAEIEAMRRMLAENNAFLQSLQTKLADCKKYTLLAPQALMYADPKALYEVASAEIATIQSMLINAKKTAEHNIRVKNNAAKRLILESTLKGAESIIHTTYRSGENAEEAQLAIYALRARHVQIDPARRELATLAPAEFKDLSIVENSLQHLSNELFSERKKLHAIKSGQCPECGAEHTASSVSEQAAAVAELEVLYKTATDDYGYLKQQNQIATRRTWLLSQIGDTPEWTKEYDAERNRLDALVKARSVSKECTQQLAILRGEEETLPEHPEAELRSKLQQLSVNQSQYLTCWQAKEQIPAKPQWDETAILSDIQRCNVYGNECNTSLLVLNQKYAECMAQNNRHASLVAKVDEIEEKLKDMPAIKSWELFWLKMVEAYGPRGLRVQKMAEIVEQILRRLPYYTSMLFDEKDMQFSYEVDASNVFIKVKRLEMDAGKGGKPVEHWFEHDISSFSGGEKRRMSVALVLTLADCVPSAKRSNILILDEIDANLDDIGQYRFANELLPALKSRYESIFVISHSEELQQAAVYDKIWKVTKKNHWSSIEMTDVGTMASC